MPIDKVRKIADGRILTGRQAKKLGLVDELGSRDDAIRLAAKLAGIKGWPSIKRFGRRPSLLELLASARAQRPWYMA